MERILKRQMHAIGAPVSAIIFAAGLFVAGAYAQTPAPSPTPAPGPTASKEQEKAHQDVDKMAKVVTDMEKAHGTLTKNLGCYWGAEGSRKHSESSTKLANAIDDLKDAIKAEADLSPEVRSAQDAVTPAVDAVNRVMDDPNHSANDEKTARDNYDKARTARTRAIEKETERIKKRLEEEGFAFESEACKPHTTPPPKPPKPPEPPKKEPEKPKETPKEKPKAAGEDEERQEIGGAPGCPGGGGQPCSTTQPSGSENAGHDSGGLGSFLGGVSIGIGVVSGDHHRHGDHRGHNNHNNEKSLSGAQSCCSHQSQSVQCPSGLPAGSRSVQFVPGGTNWATPTGGQVFVPQTSFPACK